MGRLAMLMLEEVHRTGMRVGEVWMGRAVERTCGAMRRLAGNKGSTPADSP
jgi:hypothetical protein